MIYELSQDLQTKLAARKFPTVIEYGPRFAAIEDWRDHLVVVERDRENADQLEPGNGFNENPRRVCNRGLAVRATIYAKSTLDGSRINEHEYECEQIVDGLITALTQWGTEQNARLGGIAASIQEARYLRKEELPQSAETWPGVVYLLRFRVSRGVYVRDYLGQARPTGAATGVENTLFVERGDGSDPETVP